MLDTRAKDAQGKLELKYGRILCAEELNITKLVAKNRSNLISRSLVNKSVYEMLVQRKVSSKPRLANKKYADKKKLKISVSQPNTQG